MKRALLNSLYFWSKYSTNTMPFGNCLW